MPSAPTTVIQPPPSRTAKASVHFRLGGCLAWFANEFAAPGLKEKKKLVGEAVQTKQSGDLRPVEISTELNLGRHRQIALADNADP